MFGERESVVLGVGFYCKKKLILFGLSPEFTFRSKVSSFSPVYVRIETVGKSIMDP